MRLAWLFPLAVIAAAPAVAQVSIGPGYGSPGAPASALGVPANSALQPTPYFPGSTKRYFPVEAARKLILEGRYAEADRVLDHFYVRQTTAETNLLKGITSLKLGDADAARWRFLRAAKITRYRDPSALTGLAAAELSLGNEDAARDILGKLRSQQEKCGTGCARNESLSRAVSALERELD
ncbi:tetratricopeptide repeat protein [Sphingomonas radiodurans]|uniref:tetratricopeptide repeat protein n=1 Tax=Sphingomonas radiodurans TaxID=2890321 RepID=UPI001E3881DE|nr:hypothetical protein [Sphingomonas radiodurans]WBH16265.1 hypothetical protein LLW23_15880 [Sphingomonas radiodurans]